jgi:glutathione S-transferase
MNMQLYVTYGSSYARLARIIAIEKALEDRVEIIEAKTRTPWSPYYQINPSGRVPYLVDDASVGMEDSQLICAFLDGLDAKPRFHNASHASDWAYLRLEFAARSMCEGIAVWGREMARPENERSPTTLAHESARAQRMAKFLRGTHNRSTDASRHGAPDPGRLHRNGAQARAWRSHGWPSAAGQLDALHLGSSFHEKDGPVLAPVKKTTLNKIGLGKLRPRCSSLLLNGPLVGSFHSVAHCR